MFKEVLTHLMCDDGASNGPDSQATGGTQQHAVVALLLLLVPVTGLRGSVAAVARVVATVPRLVIVVARVMAAIAGRRVRCTMCTRGVVPGVGCRVVAGGFPLRATSSLFNILKRSC